MPLPPQARWAKWAVTYGPMVLPYVKRLYEQGRWRQLAILHARTIDGGEFSWEMLGGERVWVVWTDGAVVATYPDHEGVGTGDFPGARPDRRTAPDEVTTQRVRRRLRERFSRDTTPDDAADEPEGP